jgi:hypothetical protein
MNLMENTFTLVKLGLLLNFFGPLVVCFSFGKNPEDVHQDDNRGHPIYLASFLHPKLFRWGLIIIAFGFILQLVA